MKKYKKQKFLYKHLVSLKTAIQSQLKLLNFKKKKWQQFQFYIQNWRVKKYQYLLVDHNLFHIQKHNRLLKRNFFYNLICKRKLNFLYGNLLKKYIKKQVRYFFKRLNLLFLNSLNTTLFFISLFERRLDVVIGRSYFGANVFVSRQLIKRKHVLVNNKVISTHQYVLKYGDLIVLHKNAYNLIKYWSNKIVSDLVLPNYVKVSYKTMQIIYLKPLIVSTVGVLPKFGLNVNAILKSYG